MFAPRRISAVGIWTLITAFSSGSSSNAVGTMLKFAAIGVISVPQKPESIPIAAMIVGSPSNFWTISGRPMPAVITGNAANALPMIMVNTAMPTAYVAGTSLRLTLAKSADTRRQYHPNHQESADYVRKARAEEKRDGVNPPERSVVEAPRIRCVPRVHNRDARHHQPAQPVDVLECYHALSDFLSTSARSFRSSRSRRVQWMISAHTAVGIAQIASCVGSTWIPFWSRKPRMRRMEPMAMKMSSPKKRAMLSTAAALALMRYRVF